MGLPPTRSALYQEPAFELRAARTVRRRERAPLRSGWTFTKSSERPAQAKAEVARTEITLAVARLAFIVVICHSDGIRLEADPREASCGTPAIASASS